MKTLSFLLLLTFPLKSFSQTAVQFSQADRKYMETVSVNFSWTNRIKVTQIDNFPIRGYFNTLPIGSPYFSTNKPNFMLLENGCIFLSFPFESRGKDLYRLDYNLSFHISQRAYIEEKIDMFKSYRLTLGQNKVFPISMSLGEVRPGSYDTSSKKYFRFTIHISADEEASLLVETGEETIGGGPPDNYTLDILDKSQVDEVKRMLDGLPDLTWWQQKAMGIIPSPQKK
jgi:hypothetical protein